MGLCEIIRPGRAIPSPTRSGASVDKGWVREGILTALSTEPSTLTEISRKLGVSKSTASYHITLLMGRGVIEVVESKDGIGGVKMKRYGLKEGSLVTLLSRKEEEAELGRLKETFELGTLSWGSSARAVSLEQVQGLLYKLFLHLFRIARSEHRALMRDYGSRVGAMFSRQVSSRPFKEALLGLTTQLASSGLSDSDLLELPNSGVSVVVSNTCIGSTFHQSNSCYFLEGIIEGAVRTMLGPNIKVSRVTPPGLPSCAIAVGRVKRLELEQVSRAILTLRNYQSMSPGRREA